MREELKSCPFCNGNAEIMSGVGAGSSYKMKIIKNGSAAILSDYKFWKSKSVWCPKCIIMKNGNGKTENEAISKAITAWNIRSKEGRQQCNQNLNSQSK